MTTSVHLRAAREPERGTGYNFGLPQVDPRNPGKCWSPFPRWEAKKPAVPFATVTSVTTERGFVPASILVGLAGFGVLAWPMPLGAIIDVASGAPVSAQL